MSKRCVFAICHVSPSLSLSPYRSTPTTTTTTFDVDMLSICILPTLPLTHGRNDARMYACTHVRIGTPADKCTQTITGTWKPLPGDGNMHMVKAHFHCHAPTCIKVEMWNNDTGKLLCRETTLVGGKGTLPGPKKFDEDGQFKFLFSFSLSFFRSLTLTHAVCAPTPTHCPLVHP